jgi:Ala-tRNA(Pro) deacylase
MDIYELLQKLDIPYIKHEHPAVYTCEEAEKYYKDIKGGKSKNLFLRNKKSDKFYLVIIESDKKLDLKKLGELLDESKLSFASSEQLMEHLGLAPGSVSPFGLVNNASKDVVVVIDSNLWKYDRLHYHPNTNTATLEISRDDFGKFLKWCGNKIIFLDI